VKSPPRRTPKWPCPPPRTVRAPRPAITPRTLRCPARKLSRPVLRPRDRRYPPPLVPAARRRRTRSPMTAARSRSSLRREDQARRRHPSRGLRLGAALSATAVTGEGVFGPESLLPALPSAGEVLGGLAALVTAPVTIGAAILGGVLYPTSTAADDTLDGRTPASPITSPSVATGGSRPRRKGGYAASHTAIPPSRRGSRRHGGIALAARRERVCDEAG
jgi:hypothetical protein